MIFVYMENEKVCKDCGSVEDIYVKIIITNENKILYQCQDCFIDDNETRRLNLNYEGD